MPGLVELHTRTILERHIEPRPGVDWPHLAALLAHERELASTGITTVFDALRVGYGALGRRAATAPTPRPSPTNCSPPAPRGFQHQPLPCPPARRDLALGNPARRDGRPSVRTTGVGHRQPDGINTPGQKAVPRNWPPCGPTCPKRHGLTDGDFAEPRGTPRGPPAPLRRGAMRPERGRRPRATLPVASQAMTTPPPGRWPPRAATGVAFACFPPPSRPGGSLPRARDRGDDGAAEPIRGRVPTRATSPRRDLAEAAFSISSPPTTFPQPLLLGKLACGCPTWRTDPCPWWAFACVPRVPRGLGGARRPGPAGGRLAGRVLRFFLMWGAPEIRPLFAARRVGAGGTGCRLTAAASLFALVNHRRVYRPLGHDPPMAAPVGQRPARGENDHDANDDRGLPSERRRSPPIRDWLFDADRDTELQDFLSHAALTNRVRRPDRRRAGGGARRATGGVSAFTVPYRGARPRQRRMSSFARLITARLLRALEAAESIGARQMVLHSPYSLWYQNNLYSEPPGYATDMLDRVHDISHARGARRRGRRNGRS